MLNNARQRQLKRIAKLLRRPEERNIVCLIFAVLGIVSIVRAGYVIPKNAFVAQTSDMLRVSSGTVRPGAPIALILKEEGLAPDQVYRLTSSLSTLYNPRQSRPGHIYKLGFTSDDRLLWFRYYAGTQDAYEVFVSTAGTCTASKIPLEVRYEEIGVQGEVQGTLWDSMSRLGVNPQIIVQFADIFSWQIDFLTECRNGDVFKLVWRRKLIDGKITEHGPVLIARYRGKRTTHTALLFEDGGARGYYDLSGNSTQRMFLRSPLTYRRISSYFSHRRFHPILKIYRPHLGIDYAAPTGTPVSTVADGRVTFAGWQGGYGKLVIIRHANGYETMYGHLSRFGKGIQPGRYVKQGSAIGYVGQTGLATGPHLDFRIKKNRQFINFMAMKIPPALAVAKASQEMFEQTKKERLLQLAGYTRGSRYAIAAR